MGRTGGRKDERVEDGAREEIVLASKLVLEEVVQERAVAPTPRERGRMYCCARGITSEYPSRVSKGTNESRIDLDGFAPELCDISAAYAHTSFRS